MAKLLTDFAHTPMLHVGHQLYKEDANHYITLQKPQFCE